MNLKVMQNILPNPLFNFFSSHSTPLANEGFVLSTSRHILISSPKALSTSSLSSSISDRGCAGIIPSQNTVQSFSSSHRHRMIGNTCFLRNGSWTEMDAMTTSIEALWSLRARAVGISPWMLLLFKNGSTMASVNSWTLSSCVGLACKTGNRKWSKQMLTKTAWMFVCVAVNFWSQLIL